MASLSGALASQSIVDQDHRSTIGKTSYRGHARMTFPSLLAPFAMLLALASCETQPKAPPAQSNAQCEL